MQQWQTYTNISQAGITYRYVCLQTASSTYLQYTQQIAWTDPHAEKCRMHKFIAHKTNTWNHAVTLRVCGDLCVYAYMQAFESAACV